MFIPLIAVTIGFIVAVIGFALSPFAAVIGAIVAVRRQENVVKVAISSGFYSFVSIILWIFFVLDLANVKVPKRILSFVHTFAYVYWLVGVIFFGIITLAINETSGASVVLATVTFLIGIGAWVVGLARRSGLEESMVPERFPRTVLIAPFVFSTLWSCLYILRAATIDKAEWALWFEILPDVGAIVWVFWSWPFGDFGGGFKRGFETRIKRVLDWRRDW